MKRLLVLLFLFLSACTPITPTTTPVPVTVVVTDTVSAPTPTPIVGDIAFLPNRFWTPGALNSAVTQDTIHSTICVPGYASSIRPPSSYTDALKVKQIAMMGYADTNLADYEEDHLIPLSVGGNPIDIRNLWPQPRYTSPYNAAVKDQLEYVLYKKVCANELDLATAQHAIAMDWVEAYRIFVSPDLGISLTPEP